MRKKRIFFLSGLVFALLLAVSLCSCSNTRNLCPAYGNHYKVEPLPY